MNSPYVTPSPITQRTNPSSEQLLDGSMAGEEFNNGTGYRAM
jgi:hypothetical protein